jgi:hypothetical protein
VAEIVPQPGEHVPPFSVRVQLTVPAPASLLTDPLISKDVATWTVAELGATDTERAGIIIVALADLLGSAAALALRVTVKSLAGGPGAVYVIAVPLAVDAGDTDPHEDAWQEIVHITPLLFTSFTSVAVNACVVLSSNVALALSKEILIRGGGGVAEAPPQLRLAAAKAAAKNASAARFLGDIEASI